jgi:hypothetical protein
MQRTMQLWIAALGRGSRDQQGSKAIFRNCCNNSNIKAAYELQVIQSLLRESEAVWKL